MEVKAKLRLNAQAAGLLVEFEAGGGSVQAVTDSFSGAHFDPLANSIGLDPSKTANLDDATSALLYELIRFQFSRDQIALDREAIRGIISRDQYATECERLTYYYMRKHSAIARESIPAPWHKGVDTYGESLGPGGAYETFAGYIAAAMVDGHFAVFESRYDSLQS